MPKPAPCSLAHPLPAHSSNVSPLSLPPRAKRSLRESIEYTFVSFEGSNPHCDARTGRGGSSSIYYIIRYIPLFPPFIPLSAPLFRFFLKKSFPTLCQFAEKSYLCTRKTGTPPTSHHGGCFPALRKKEFFDRFS